MQYTQAQIENAYSTTLLTNLSVMAGISMMHVLSSELDIRLTSHGGGTTLSYYPDFDDNANAPATFVHPDLPGELRLSYNQLITKLPLVVNEVLRWVSPVIAYGEAYSVSYLISPTVLGSSIMSDLWTPDVMNDRIDYMRNAGKYFYKWMD